MGLEFEATGVEHVLDTFEAMEGQIDAFGKEIMFDGLLAWQIIDMHRKYPNTSQDDERTVSTEIWPRSRVTMLMPLLKVPSNKKPRRVYAPPRMAGAAASHRPILRQVLFDMLVARMGALMEQMLKWQTKG
jgi:hypothetical protein